MLSKPIHWRLVGEQYDEMAKYATALREGTADAESMMLQQVIAEQGWKNRLTDEDLRGITPLFYAHINPYGTFHLDMNTRLAIQEVLAA